MELDPRIVRIGVEVNGATKYYEDLAISVSGNKFANANENDCELTITNLSRETRDYILTETSPFLKSKTPKKIIVEAGRVSTGTSIVFIGDIISATPSQPPDIALTIKATTKSSAKGEISTVSMTEKTSLSKIAKTIATELGLTLVFQADDKKIASFSFTGSKSRYVEQLAKMGNVNAYIDDEKLIVKNADVALTGSMQILDLDSGMIGIPEITEHGIKVKYLFNAMSEIGGALQVTSIMNPIANGTYTIFKLSFDLATRDVPFYLTAEAKRQ